MNGLDGRGDAVQLEKKICLKDDTAAAEELGNQPYPQRHLFTSQPLEEGTADERIAKDIVSTFKLMQTFQVPANHHT
jgi:hypothetical protein